MGCEANICRSPVAAALGQLMLPDFKSISAGLFSLRGLGAHPEMIRLMAARGLDLSPHMTQIAHPLLCDRAELILAMTREQQNRLCHRHPHLTEKIYRLGHFENIDIPDPIGQSPAFFAEVVQQIELCLKSWQARLEPGH